VKRYNNPLDHDQPWLVFSAIDFLQSLLNKEMTVWEYGSGSSTLFYAKRVKTVYSIENDKSWFEHITTLISTREIANVKYNWIERDPESGGGGEEYFSKSTKQYFILCRQMGTSALLWTCSLYI
jgi:hypothetical protein